MSEELILLTYEGIARLTRQMLTAAQAGQWDALVQLERDCSALFAQLFTGDEDRPRSEDFQRRKAQLIRGVLKDDAAIRLLVEPWLNQLGALLQQSGHQRRLARAYRPAE